MEREQKTRTSHTTNGTSPEANSFTTALERKPQLQGWLFVGSGLILLLHVWGYLTFVNYILIAIALYLIFQGAVKVHLLEKIQEAIAWVKQKIK
jgi:hypothetical protein